MKRNYKIVVEIPREIRTRHAVETTVDTFVSFVYGRKNEDSALRAFGSVENLRRLRKQGFHLTRAEFKKFRTNFHVVEV